MAAGKKTGGRQKGSINAKTQTIWELVDKTGQNPIDVVWAFAMNDWKFLGYEDEYMEKATKMGPVYEDRIQPKERLDAAKFLCNKMYPDLKSIELGGAEDLPPIELNNNFTLKDLIKIARDNKKNEAAK